MSNRSAAAARRVVPFDPMSRERRLKRQIVLRLDDELHDRVVAYTERVRRETGLDVTVSNAIRRLLAEALDAEERETKRRR